MKRQVLCGLLAAASLSLPVQAARAVPVQADGTVLKSGSYVEQGVTYVPLRYLLDALGGWTVSWDSAEQEAVAVSGSLRLAADPAADTITIGGREYAGRVTVENGRTYVPLRLVTEALGGSAEWDPYLGGAAVTSAGAAHDAADFYWLSRIISAESGGECLEGQIAVGNVVLNRVKSRECPNTVKSVVFDTKNGVQFEPTSNGTIYDPPTDSAVLAAKLCLEGADVVGDCLYFYAPALSAGRWIVNNRTYHTTSGCHKFYR